MSQAHVDFDLIPYYVFSDNARTIVEGSPSNRQGRLWRGDPAERGVHTRGRRRAVASVHDAGGMVVAIDRPPTASCNGLDNNRVRTAVSAIWGTTASKRGKSAVTTYDKLETCLIDLNVPDVRIPSRAKKLLYCHRQLHGKDLYFFANTGADPITPPIELHGVSGVPTLWDPVSGRIADCAGLYGRGRQVDVALGSRGIRVGVRGGQSRRCPAQLRGPSAGTIEALHHRRSLAGSRRHGRLSPCILQQSPTAERLARRIARPLGAWRSIASPARAGQWQAGRRVLLVRRIASKSAMRCARARTKSRSSASGETLVPSLSQTWEISPTPTTNRQPFPARRQHSLRTTVYRSCGRSRLGDRRSGVARRHRPRTAIAAADELAEGFHTPLYSDCPASSLSL